MLVRYAGQSEKRLFGHDESFELTVSEFQIEIKVFETFGLHRAFSTLLQLIVRKQGKCFIREAKITDAPQVTPILLCTVKSLKLKMIKFRMPPL